MTKVMTQQLTAKKIFYVLINIVIFHYQYLLFLLWLNNFSIRFALKVTKVVFSYKCTKSLLN